MYIFYKLTMCFEYLAIIKLFNCNVIVIIHNVRILGNYTYDSFIRFIIIIIAMKALLPFYR